MKRKFFNAECQCKLGTEETAIDLDTQLPWLYIKEPFEYTGDDSLVGFVYLITRISDSDNGYPNKYIGKKQFKLRTRIGRVGSKRQSVQYKESDWKSYYGSSKELLEDVRKYGKNGFIREILHLCTSKAEMTYLEVQEQFERDVLNKSGSEIYYNKNILGKFYTSFQKDEILLTIHQYFEDNSNRVGNNHNKKWINNGNTNKITSKTEAAHLVSSGRWVYGRTSTTLSITDGNSNKYINNGDKIPDGFYIGCTKKRIKKGKINKLLPIEQAEELLNSNTGWSVGFSGNDDYIWIHNGEEELKIHKEFYSDYPTYSLGRLHSIFPKGHRFMHKDGVCISVISSLVKKKREDGWEIGNCNGKGLRWVHKDYKLIRIPQEKVEIFIKDGWQTGIPDIIKDKYAERDSSIKGKIAVNKDGITKYANKEEVDSYVNAGFSLGSSNSPMLGKNHSEETKLKIAKPGAKNGNAGVIHIFNANDHIMFTCVGNFKETCENNNLPFFLLRSSLQKTTKIANTSKYILYRGWYARRN